MIENFFTDIASLGFDAWLASMERLVNKALEYDSAAQLQLKSLDGRILCVECTLPPCKFYEVYSGGQVYYHQRWDTCPDTTLHGSAMALSILAMNKNDLASFKDTGVEVTGDVSLLRQVRRILHNLDIDWEAAFAGLVGDATAHMAGNSLRAIYKWQKDVTERTGSMAGKFVKEQIKIVPTQTSVKAFARGVHHLAEDTERFAERLDLLAQRINKLGDKDV